MSSTVSKIRAANIALYRSTGQIHAKAVDGRFNRLRWAMVWLSQAIFYGACWLTYESQGVVRQAILFDIPHDKLYLFGLVLWPQDALLLACALILAAAALFWVTALAGRLFCGFACPQTIYTMIFTWIEARIEGDHLARVRLDQGPRNTHWLARKGLKHGLWLLLALWTGISFVGYFTPIRELLPALGAGRPGPWEAFWVLFYAAFTYVQAGLAREAVCQHMCPYSRFQGVMFDPGSRMVGYDRERGEPRSGSRLADGGCIDCGICVQVCPTAIDIRDGLQYQCINCGLCIDACDRVMQKTGAPGGLVRFASAGELAGRPVPAGLRQRPRLAAYAALALASFGLAAWHLQQRSLLRVDVLRDRGALLRETVDGRIENAYTLKLINLDEQPRRYRVAVSGWPGLEIVGEQEFEAAPGSVRPVFVTVAARADGGPPGARPIGFEVVAVQEPATRAWEESSFVMP